jgi:3-oxoacyl-[acyl-carrier-protein] synthase-3
MGIRTAIITGTGRSVPDRILTNKDLEKIVDTSDEWIRTRTGIHERRIAAEGEGVSVYAGEAGRQAIEAAGVAPEQIDLVILATVTPDMPIPATSCLLQHQLGCVNATAFDMQAGCSGFIYAQSVAKQFLLTGRSNHVLVIGAELLSKYLDWSDRATCVIFADGAGAVVMSAGESPRGVLASAMHTDGAMTDFICMPGGGAKNPPSTETLAQGLHFIRMRGNETFKMAVRSLEDVCREVLDAAALTPDDVDWFIPHQANRRIIDAVGSRLGIGDDRCYVNIERYGNTSAASIPIALDEAVRDGKIKSGDVVLMAAFGAGLTWAGSVVRW